MGERGRGGIARQAVGLQKVVEGVGGKGGVALERRLHDRRDVEEARAPLEEGGDRHLVGRVQDRWRGPSR